jgi:beta-glucanase (GH16 family)
MNERQLYTKQNHNIAKNQLTITAKRKGYVYSTRITTKGKKEFQYGRFEASKAASWSRCMASFWMLGSNISEVGWPKCGEIDILEYVEKNQIWFYLFAHSRQSRKYY